MKDLGEPKKILGIKIEKDRVKGTVSLSQKQYLKKVLHQFSMVNNTKYVSTPLAPHFKLNASMSPRTHEEREDRAWVPYVSAVGSLMYVMVHTSLIFH